MGHNAAVARDALCAFAATLALAQNDLKTAFDDVRAQRDAWQAMALARIRPAQSRKSPWSWVRSIG
jgi:hypothetical protein